MDKKTDMKCNYPTSALWVPTNTMPATLTALGEDYSLSNIKRMDSTATSKDKTRFGDTCRIHRIRLQGCVQNVTATENTYRIMVVRWANNDFSDIDLNSLLMDNATNGAAWSFTDHNCPYQILWDKRGNVGTDGGLSPRVNFSLDKKFKGGLLTAFDPSATTGTYADTQKGLIRVYVCSNAGNAVIKYTWQVYFTDV